MPITDILAEGDLIEIRVAVTDSLGNLVYFPGEDGDAEIVKPTAGPPSISTIKTGVVLRDNVVYTDAAKLSAIKTGVVLKDDVAYTDAAKLSTIKIGVVLREIP
jgi:hypothetical protein